MTSEEFKREADRLTFWWKVVGCIYGVSIVLSVVAMAMRLAGCR